MEKKLKRKMKKEGRHKLKRQNFQNLLSKAKKGQSYVRRIRKTIDRTRKYKKPMEILLIERRTIIQKIK
jgi:hypothetical protein